MMTSRKQNNGQNPPKPLTPALSAAFHRASKPLTPRLANPGGYPSRKLVADHVPPSSLKGSPSASPGPFLKSNITPRSGPRLKNTKQDERFTPPTSPPTRTLHSRHPSLNSQISAAATPASNTVKSRKGGSPVRSSTKPDLSKIVTTKPMDMLTPPLGRTSRPSSLAEGSGESSPKFFHASDAQSVLSDSDEKPAINFRPVTTFVYANGAVEHQASRMVESSPIIPSSRRPARAMRPSLLGIPQGTPSPRLMSPRFLDSSSRFGDDARSTISSLADDASDVGSQVRYPMSRTLNGNRPPLSQGEHVKSASIDLTLRRTPSRDLPPNSAVISPSASHSSHDAVPPVSVTGRRPRIFSNSSNASADTHVSRSHSPGKVDAGLEPIKEVNSRIERRIMDLEISNSSLLAINRTLEREMRKQNAELRRFRRLSRAGRLSLIPARSLESLQAAGKDNEQEERDEQSSASDSDNESEPSEEDSNADDSGQGQESNSDNDTRLRVGDEKKVYIDLARHQELLAGSRKMNHSLKRCLAWTEDLIKEARKALEYKVRANDASLGGRVLPPEELTDIEESSHGLLSPSAGIESVISPNYRCGSGDDEDDNLDHDT